MSLEQFLDWEERQELRYEFDGFQPIAMTGGTVAHDRITFSVGKELDARLAGKPCRPFGPNVKILTGGRVRYPDAVVSCAPQSSTATCVDAPIVVFEVISEDGARTDRIEKLREYQATPSIQCYVILEQKSIGAMVFSRRAEMWSAAALTESDALELPQIDVSVPLPAFYAGVILASADSA